MNILHIDTEYSWRGGEQQLVYLIDGLKKRGHRNLVVCQPESRLSQRDGIENHEVHFLKMRGEWDFFAIARIRKIIKEKSADIIHMHTAHAQTLGIFASMGLAECKRVVSRRVDFHLRSPFSKFIKYRKADSVIAISNGVRNVLIEDGIAPDKIRVIHSGIDLRRFGSVNGQYLLRELGLDRDKTVVGIVAALAAHKDHRNFVLAAKKVREELPGVVFLIVGDGELRDSIVALIERLGLDDSVKMLGFRDDIPELLSIIDIFVLSSYLEGMGTSILDAMASGLPVVASSVGGIKEVVRDSRTGILVPPRNPEALANGIITLVKSRDLRERYGREAKIVAHEYSCDRMVEETENLYKSLFIN